jgi:hypothetical protein
MRHASRYRPLHHPCMARTVSPMRTASARPFWSNTHGRYCLSGCGTCPGRCCPDCCHRWPGHPLVLHIYRIQCQRKAHGRVRSHTGHVWVIAGPDGAVLCRSLHYPSLQLIEDCEHAFSHNVGTIRPDAARSGQHWPAAVAAVQSAPDGS